MNKITKAYLMFALISMCYLPKTLTATYQQEKAKEPTQTSFVDDLEAKHFIAGAVPYALFVAWLYKNKGRDVAFATVVLPLMGYMLAAYPADNPLSS